MTSSRCSRLIPRFSFPAGALFIVAVLGAFAPCPVRAQRPLGIDVSDYQTSLNWWSVKTSGVSFAWAKATEGLTGNETTFVNNQVNARAAGVLIGAYHYAHPENQPGTAGALQEAEHFWNVASNYITGGGVHLMPMIDVESNLSGAGYTKQTLCDWVNTWCSNIVARAAAAGVTVKPVVYTYQSYASSWMNSSITYWPVWMAQYPASPNPQTGAPAGYAPWTTWNFWQYTGTGTQAGNYGDCDQDVFNGTAASLAAFVIGTNTSPPSFQAQPSSRFADRGGTLKLTASVVSTIVGPAPKFQWRLNGANIPGATANPLVLSNIQTNQAGSYTVVVTNANGGVTSSVASLAVNPLFVPVFADNFDTNSSANWASANSSADNRVTFAYDYSALGIPSAPNSVGGTKKGLRLEANLSAGAASAVSLSPIGKSFVGDYRLHFDMWINVNGPLPGGGVGSTESITAGVGTAGGRVQWNGSGSTADGVWFQVDGDGGIGDTTASQGDFAAYIGPTVQTVASGVYAAGTGSTAKGNSDPYYANVFPAGATPPTAQTTAYTKQEGGLAVGTVGLGWHDVVVNKSGGTVQWYIDGLRIATVSAASITASNVTVGYWDQFASISDNTNLSFGLIDNLRVEIPAVAPALVTQPFDLAVKVLSNVTFTASATGVPTPVYQWKFNGAPISGATNTSYTIASVQYPDAGTYSVVATNAAGAATSTNALLSIITASPAVFDSYAVLPDYSLRMVLTGDPGATYYVQCSTNLVDWMPLTNVTLIGTSYPFNAGSVTNNSQLYFRARSGP